jgi:hypothetical protein
MQPSRKPQPRTLAEEFEVSYQHTKALAERLVEEHVDYLKSCYQDLPRQTLLREATKFSQCWRQWALDAIELNKQRV